MKGKAQLDLRALFCSLLSDLQVDNSHSLHFVLLSDWKVLQELLA